MQHFSNLLVGVDLSRGDRICSADLTAATLNAVERGIWLGQMARAEVTFFAALDVSPQAEHLLATDFEHASRDVRDAAEEVLAELVDRARAAGVVAHSAFTLGKPWREIIRRAIGGGHDLVIVGTRDSSAASRLVLGSTAAKLLRKCPCPVWVTKAAPESEIANILVASDLSDVSEQALKIAVGAAQLMQARVRVLHVLEWELDGRFWLTRVPEEGLAAHRQALRTAAERKLHEQLARTDYRTLTHGVQVELIDGLADEVILRAIAEHEIDLLVMGTSRRGTLPELLIGHTAERLLPQLTCSVLAVKPADFVCPVSVD
jgi:universal stress protein E